jgi:hypothetical protein
VTETEERTIHQIFADVKREVGPVGKDSVNKQQNFKFRGIDAVVNAAAEALDKYGVITIPVLQKITYSTVEVGGARTLMGHVAVEVMYQFTGPGGDHFNPVVPGEAMDSGDKATAKAMSVAYRICLLQTLNLPTGDLDPDSQTYQRSDARQQSAGNAFEDAAPRNDRQPDKPVPPALDPDDDWVKEIAGIHTAEDADAAEAKLKQQYDDSEQTSADKERTRQVLHWIRVKAAPMRTAAKSAEHRDTGKPADPPADEGWVADFMARLNAAELAGLPARGEIGQAVAARKITPEDGAALSAEWVKRKRQLEDAARQVEASAA